MRCTNKGCRQAKDFYVITEDIKKKFLGFIYYNKVTREKITPSEIGNDIFNYQDDTFECAECGQRMTGKEAINAYNDPMSIFDTGNLCVCGGEIWSDIEFVKEEIQEDSADEFSGYQRKVKAGSVKTTKRCDKCNKEY